MSKRHREKHSLRDLRYTTKSERYKDWDTERAQWHCSRRARKHARGHLKAGRVIPFKSIVERMEEEVKG